MCIILTFTKLLPTSVWFYSVCVSCMRRVNRQIHVKCEGVASVSPLFQTESITAANTDCDMIPHMNITWVTNCEYVGCDLSSVFVSFKPLTKQFEVNTIDSHQLWVSKMFCWDLRFQITQISRVHDILQLQWEATRFRLDLRDTVTEKGCTFSSTYASSLWLEGFRFF